ncbi:hypothetical protein EDB84DRAFT_500797 [Lactarius hengduanensis]|nr:hypothetical protein EDB84DRAFT_500797 [Lactarius hengduanensis]
MSSPFLTISLTRGLSKSARTARSCSSSPGLYRFSTTRRSKCSSFLFPHQMIQRDRKIEEHPRLLHRAGYPHRFCPRHDVLGSTHGAHQCTIQLVQPHTRAAAAASHPCVKNRRRTPPHRSTSMVLASCCIYSHVTPHHLTSRQSLRCTRHLGARWRDFDFPATAVFPLASAHSRTTTQRSVFGEGSEFNTAILLALHRVHKVHKCSQTNVFVYYIRNHASVSRIS